MAQRRELPPNFHSHEYGGIQAPHGLLLRPAYTVLPFLRSPLGYEIVQPFRAIRHALQLIVLPVLAEFLWVGFFPQRTPPPERYPYLSIFALAYLAVSLVLFAWRWWGQRKGEEVHTAETGYSWLAWYTRLPVTLCELVIVPGAVFALGYALDQAGISMELGWWLMACGVSLLLMALWEFRRNWAQRRATTDDMVRAKAFEARVDRHGIAAARPQAGRDGPDFADLV